MQQTQGKKISTEYPQRTYERIELASTSEGLTPNEWVYATVMSRLDTEGF